MDDLTTESSFDSLFVITISKGVCTTRRWQTAGRLVVVVEEEEEVVVVVVVIVVVVVFVVVVFAAVVVFVLYVYVY